MIQERDDDSAQLASGLTGAVVGPLLLYCWLVNLWLGAAATTALVTILWLVPSLRNAAATLVASAAAVAVVLLGLLMWWGTAVGS